MVSRGPWPICHLAIVLLQQRIVCGQDVDKERFPLSGGVDNGVNVRLTVGSVEENVNVDFLAPDRHSTFNWFVDVAAGKIQRQIMDAQSQEWGKWPLDAEAAQKPVNFDFYKTKYAWKVSINDVRMPWFDVALHAEYVTPVHVEVSTNADKLITQTRPVCKDKCHVTECNSTEGEFSCPAGKDCFTRQVQMDASHAVCHESQDSGSQADTQCCTGEPQPVDMRSVEVKQWAKVRDDADHVSAACGQYSVGLENPISEADALRCGVANGTVVRIETKNQAEGLLTVWAPSLWSIEGAETDTEVLIRMPPYVLFDKEPTKQLVEVEYSVLETLMGTTENPSQFIHKNDGFILKLSPEAEEANMTQNTFINMMTSADGHGRWYRWFSDRYSYTHAWYKDCDAQLTEKTVLFILSDEEVPATACMDDEQWVDSVGRNCSTYETNAWCTEFGETTQEFLDANDNKNIYEFGNNSQAVFFSCDRSDVNWAATWACCSCGGGYHEAPSEASDSVLYQ